MSSKLEIINLALSRISQKPIADVNENTVQAEAATRVWDESLRFSLRSHDWGFATAVQALTLITTYTPLGYQFAYFYSTACLALWHVYNEGTIDKDVGEEFRELYDPVNNQKVIVTDCEDAYGEFTYNLTDTALFDATFIDAFAYKIAAELAIALNNDKESAKSLIALFNGVISEAERMSTYENKQAKKKQNPYVDARG